MKYQITVVPSQRNFTVEAEETILQAANREAIGLPYGCQDGVCGSCKCTLLAGEVSLLPYQEKTLTPEERERGVILACRAIPQSDLQIESKQVAAVGVFPIKKMPCRVIDINKVLDDVVILTLQLPANDAFQYHAGQYVNFLLKDGSYRSYSMASAPHNNDKQIQLHIRHLSGGKFTDHVFQAMQAKEILRIEGPHGSFFLREDSNKPMIFLASGTGIAPIKALLEHLVHHNNTRMVKLYWGVRLERDLYLHTWLVETSKKWDWLSYIPVVSNETWQGRCGFVHQAVLDDHTDLSNFQVYACGVPAMVNAARSSFITTRQLPEAEFFADAFISEKDKVSA